MKKLIALFLCLTGFYSSPLIAKINVVTTITDLAAITQEVGKEWVEVKSIATADQDPHFLEPKPSYIVSLSRADLLVSVGLELEIGWLPVLLNQARNPKIQVGQKGYLETSSGLKLLEIPTGAVDRSMGDVHPLGNPHYWLNPENGILISKNIASRLAELDPAHRGEYQKNQADFELRLKKTIEGLKEKIASLQGKKIITQHKSFSYFADWAGLQVIDFIEPKPGIPPTASHLISLIQKIQSEKITLLAVEPYYDPKPAKELSEKTKIPLLVLPTSVGGDPSVKTYEDLFTFLLNKVSGAH